jgi:hypothetical protein
MTLMERLMAKVSPEPNTGCWLWTASVDGRGYGQITVVLPDGKRPRRAHRLMLQHATGSEGDGLAACHRCDNSLCVNPEHLYWGTKAQNSQDMAKRGRQQAQKLLPEDIVGIVRAHGDGESLAEIAEAYGVTKSHVGNIMSGREWSHLTGIKRSVA